MEHPTNERREVVATALRHLRARTAGGDRRQRARMELRKICSFSAGAPRTLRARAARRRDRLRSPCACAEAGGAGSARRRQAQWLPLQEGNHSLIAPVDRRCMSAVCVLSGCGARRLGCVDRYPRQSCCGHQEESKPLLPLRCALRSWQRFTVGPASRPFGPLAAHSSQGGAGVVRCFQRTYCRLAQLTRL